MLFFLKTARGEQVSIGELLRGGPYLLSVVLAWLLTSLTILAVASCFILPLVAVCWLALPNVAVGFRLLAGLLSGGLLAAIPCVVVALMLSQHPYLILDRNAGVIESLSVSKRITAGNKLMLLAIYAAALMGSMVIHQATFNLGVFVTVPFMLLMSAVIYLAMTGQATAGQSPPGGAGRFAPTAAGSPFGGSSTPPNPNTT
jgi:uncharacterized membrane protein